MNKSKFGILTIIAIIALIGFSTTGCDDGSGGDLCASGHDINWITGYTSVNDNVCRRSGCNHIAALGDRGPGGGFIFYVAPASFTVQEYSGGTGSFTSYQACYLEAAPTDSGIAQWGPWSQADYDALVIAGLTTWSTYDAKDAGLQGSIGSGRKDTKIIVNHLGANESGRAAQLAAAYQGGGYNDWFLPSFGELNLLYENRAHVGNLMILYRYWSSSQYDRRSAWYVVFGFDGYHHVAVKEATLYFHAIRAF